MSNSPGSCGEYETGVTGKLHPEHCDHFSEVVRDLKERDTQTE